MKITMLDTVEDSNVFTDSEEIKAASTKAAMAFARQHRTQKANDKVVILRKTDLLRKGETYDVPASQGENLVKLKMAEEVKETEDA